MQSTKINKQPLLQCKFCSRFYPPEHKIVLATHLQYHIEKSPHQQAGNHICPWDPIRKEKKFKVTCGRRFLTPELLAVHTLEYHTKTRYTPLTSERYRKAHEESQAEKERLIQKISKQENNPQRLFYPKENINEQ